MLEDTFFCENLRIFGKFGRLRKEDMIILFNGGRLGKCLLRSIANNIFSFYFVFKENLESLEQELKIIEGNMIVNASPNLKDMWTEKKNCLNLILDEKVKGELKKNVF